MRWTKEQLEEHPKRDALTGIVPHTRSGPPAEPPPEPVLTVSAPVPGPPPLGEFPLPPYAWPIDFPEGTLEMRFTVPGMPVAKPRMTKRDTWAKRPCVLRYREFCDRMRAAAGPLPDVPPAQIHISIFMPMPVSWSKKKKSAMAHTRQRQKPDFDNFIKSIDGLFDDDSAIYWGDCLKTWCWPGEERAEVWVLFHT